jgi:multidrug transporter EmrE-like cation transporter
MTVALWMILVSTLLNTAAQVLLKLGVQQVGSCTLPSDSYLQMALHFCGNPFIAIGVSCYGISLLFWLRALSEVDLSYGVPLLSLGYVLTALAGVFFFQEALTFPRIVGIGLILGGVYLVAKTA